MIVGILNQKGGVGKTTLAVNISRVFMKLGYKTTLIDTDSQGSARDYNAAGNGDYLNVIALDRPTLHKDIMKLRDDYDWILLDGAPRIENMAISAIKCCDIVLIPVQPSPLDIWGTADLVDIIKARQEITEGRPKAAFVISRRLANTNIGKEAKEVLSDFALPVFESGTANRVIYSTSAKLGKGVIDVEPDGAAAIEINNIVKELEEFM
tara:strand:- start:519 stop:1145 length:627 start_codon:yes stop_codon:yes gene_type:complete